MFTPSLSPGRQNLPEARQLPRMAPRRQSPRKMTRLPTRPTSSRLVRLLLRGWQLRRPGPSPRRNNTSGNVREGRVLKHRRDLQMPAIPALAVTEALIQMRYSNNSSTMLTDRRTQRASHSSHTFLDKTGLVRLGRAAPSLRHLWCPRPVPVMRMGRVVVRTGYLPRGGMCLEARTLRCGLDCWQGDMMGTVRLMT